MKMIAEKMQIEMDILESMPFDGMPKLANDIDHVYSWRDEAMNEALRGFDNQENVDALLHAVRTHRPDAATLILWPNRARLLRFLRERCDGMRSMLTASHRFLNESTKGYDHYMGWFAADWERATVEVAISPDMCTEADVVVIAPNDRVLFSFADALV